jgi:hypothetical protein
MGYNGSLRTNSIYNRKDTTISNMGHFKELLQVLENNSKKKNPYATKNLFLKTNAPTQNTIKTP